MLTNFCDDLKSKKASAKKKLKKKGTLQLGIVEATPVVWKGELLRFEWIRNNSWGAVEGVTREIGCYHFVDMKTNIPTNDFAQDHSFGCCYEENGIMYVHGIKGPGGGTVIDTFWSEDLINWHTKEALSFSDDIKLYNTSVCKGADGYIMAIEIGGTSKWVGKPFTCIFAKSTNLIDWELIEPEKHNYCQDRYTACPAIRYVDGYYYIICLEKMPGHRWVPYIARSNDLKLYQLGIYNPVMWFDDDDKIVQYPEQFSDDQLEYIANAVDCNNSDIDLCEYNGKTVILYSWGNQFGKEFLAEAEYDGTLEEFLKSFFVD